jgi:hypothetical protein
MIVQNFFKFKVVESKQNASKVGSQIDMRWSVKQEKIISFISFIQLKLVPRIFWLEEEDGSNFVTVGYKSANQYRNQHHKADGPVYQLWIPGGKSEFI